MPELEPGPCDLDYDRIYGMDIKDYVLVVPEHELGDTPYDVAHGIESSLGELYLLG